MRFINKVKISRTGEFKIPLENKDYKPLKEVRYKDFDLKEFFGKLNHLRFGDFKTKEKNVAKAILNVFLHEDIRLGPAEFIRAGEKEILRKINQYIKKGLPIVFTILGFPFKAANPLKTTRRMPDLGELGFILRVSDIVRLIQGVYPSGAKFILLDEGLAFYDFFGVSKREATDFRKELIKWTYELGLQKVISFKDLAGSLQKLPDFESKYQENLKLVENQFKKEEKETVKKIRGLVPTIFMSLNTKNYPLKDLFLVYNLKIRKNVLPEKIKTIRQELFEKAQKTAIRYTAFHKTRYDTKSIDRLFPDALRCTVAPKPGSLGILGINKNTKLLPHHGVGILTKDNNITVEYEADVRRTGRYKAVFIRKESTPFYYKEI